MAASVDVSVQVKLQVQAQITESSLYISDELSLTESLIKSILHLYYQEICKYITNKSAFNSWNKLKNNLRFKILVILFISQG